VASQELNAIVMQRIELSRGLMVLRIAPDGWELPEFSAGQFAVLGLPGTARRFIFSDEGNGAENAQRLIKRAYSIASSSVNREYLEFYIVLMRSGALTPRLFALMKGDRLWLGPKFSGVFTIDEVPEDRHVVLIGTGTGLAPYMSMLRTHLVCGGKRRFAVLHGARHSWDLGYRSELETLDRLCQNFTYIPSISRSNEEAVPWRGETGYIQDLWTRRPLKTKWDFQFSPDDAAVFVCGNPEMAENMVQLLMNDGFQEPTNDQQGNIHIERYW